jgi:putative transposase
MNSEAQVFITKNHTKGLNQHHFVWCPKFRFNCFQKEATRKDMENILQEIAKEKKILIHSMTIEPDHVHMFVSIPFSMSVSQAKQFLKGISSYRMFRLHPNFRKRYPEGNFWSAGTFSRSISNVTSTAVNGYIEKHDHVMLSKVVAFEKTPDQSSLADFF